MKKDSDTIRFLRTLWDCHDRMSWERLNHNTSKALLISIRGFFEIEEGDFGRIAEEFRWRYWAGTSLNGHHLGERFYKEACRWRSPAARVFEHDFSRVPFILDGQRLFEGSGYSADGWYWRVTGWSKDNETLHVVGYDNRRREGTRQLKSFERKDWLDYRKRAKHL